MILMIPNSLHRLVEENNNNKDLPVVEMTQLEEELDAALMHIRSRKVVLFICCYLFKIYLSIFDFELVTD